MEYINLLEKGSMVKIKKGMVVDVEIKESFCYRKVRTSTKVIRAEVKIGKEYSRGEIFKKPLVDFLEDDINRIIPVSREKVEAFVDSLDLDQMKEPFDTSIYIGNYYVRDTYPIDDNTVCMNCGKIDNPSVRVNLYAKVATIAGTIHECAYIY